MRAATSMLLSRRGLLTATAGLACTGPAEADDTELKFDQLYSSIGVRGMAFSDTVRDLTGSDVRMFGYMAPPLKAESHFFVLTREPLTLCPFCQSDAEWPVDIVVVYLRRVAPLLDGGTRVLVRGRLEAGSWTDPESGFVSLLRLVQAVVRAV
ncbi:MAG: hypothetical protein AB7O80_18140 [Acetobacteraceae bacterium]